jgi:hypothetical protein
MPPSIAAGSTTASALPPEIWWSKPPLVESGLGDFPYVDGSSGALRLPGAAAFIAAFAGTLSTTMLPAISSPFKPVDPNPRRKEWRSKVADRTVNT